MGESRMEYGGIEGDINAYTGNRFKSPVCLGLYVLVGIAAFTSFFLGFWEWDYMDLKGECIKINSGREYYNEWGVCKNETGTPSAEQEGWCSASSVKELVLRYCEQHEGVDLDGKEPYFGQCSSPPLSMATGATGMLVALLAACRCAHSCHAVVTISASVVGSAACVLGAACFIASFYVFGHNIDERSNYSTGSCHYDYSGTTGDYKAMTAFAFITAFLSMLVAAEQCMIVAGSCCGKTKKSQYDDSTFDQFM